MTTSAPAPIAGFMSGLTEPVQSYVPEVRGHSVLENAFPPRYEDIRRFARFFDERVNAEVRYALSLQDVAESMSQNDDGSAFLHSDELRASWVHLRESLLEDVRNRQAFAQKLTVIATELRKRMKSCDDALQQKRNTQKVDNSYIYHCRQRHTQWSNEAQISHKLYYDEESNSMAWLSSPVQNSPNTLSPPSGAAWRSTGHLPSEEVSRQGSNSSKGSSLSRSATKLRSLFDGGRSTGEQPHRRANSHSVPPPPRRVSREEMYQADAQYRLENIRLNRALEQGHLNMEKVANDMLSALQDSVEWIKKGLAQYGANLNDVSHSALQSASHIINDADTISSLKSTAPLYEQVQEDLEKSKSLSIRYVDPNYPEEPCSRILFGLELDEQALMALDLEGGIPAILHHLMDDIARRGVDEPNIYRADVPPKFAQNAGHYLERHWTDDPDKNRKLIRVQCPRVRHTAALLIYYLEKLPSPLYHGPKLADWYYDMIQQNVEAHRVETAQEIICDALAKLTPIYKETLTAVIRHLAELVVLSVDNDPPSLSRSLSSTLTGNESEGAVTMLKLLIERHYLILQ